MARGAKLPEKGAADARRTVRRAGEVFYRVHSRRRAADRFNPEPQDHHFGGGRFDSTPNDSYAYLYAAPRPETAIIERFVRTLRFDGLGNSRILLRKELEGRLLSQVRLTRDVELVSLCSILHLNAVQQSDWWLVESDPTEYAFTRRWGTGCAPRRSGRTGSSGARGWTAPTSPWSCSAPRPRATCSR